MKTVMTAVKGMESDCIWITIQVHGTTSTTSDTEDSPQCNYMSTNRGSFRGNNRQQHQQRRRAMRKEKHYLLPLEVMLPPPQLLLLNYMRGLAKPQQKTTRMIFTRFGTRPVFSFRTAVRRLLGRRKGLNMARRSMRCCSWCM